MAKTIAQTSLCFGGNKGAGLAVSKRFITSSDAHYWWPRRKDGEINDDEGSGGDQAPQVESSRFRDPRLKIAPAEGEGLSKEIYILGVGNLGAFVAHSLAGIPDRPPITLLLRRRQLQCWDESDRFIKITSRNVTESRNGFGFEILRPSVQNQQASEERNFLTDLDAANQIQVEDGPPQPVFAFGNEEQAATGTIGLSLDDSNPLSDSGYIPGGAHAASEVSHISPGAEAETNSDTRTGPLNARGEKQDTFPRTKDRSDTPNPHGKFDEEHDEVIYNLIVTVKAPQTLRALQAVAHRLVRSSTILFLQNGMGVVDEVNDKLFPDEEHRPTYMIGVVSHGLYSTKTFSVFHAGEGTMALGVMPRLPMVERSFPENMRQLAPSARYLLRTMTRTPVFVAVGFPPTDLLQQQLDKLAVNCIINPLTALLDCNNGVLLSKFSLTRVTRLLLAEISLVLRSLPELKNVPNVNMRFDPQRLERLVFSVANNTAANRSSMLQDTKAGKQTEIDYINGYIVKRGEEMGVYCVMNYMLVHLIKGKRKIAEEQADFLPFAVGSR